MLPITGYAPLNGWKQVGAPHWAYMEAHTFEASSSGELLHFTSGQLRAVVPPEGFADYLALWPMAEPIVAQITGRRPAADPDPASAAPASSAAIDAAPAEPASALPAAAAAPASSAAAAPHSLMPGEMPPSSTPATP